MDPFDNSVSVCVFSHFYIMIFVRYIDTDVYKLCLLCWGIFVFD